MRYCNVMNVTLCVSIAVASYCSYPFTNIHYIFYVSKRNVMHLYGTESQAPAVCVTCGLDEVKPLVTLSKHLLIVEYTNQ